MKRFSLVILLTLAFTSLAYAQQPTPSPSASPAAKPAMSKAQSQRMLIATEKKLWEAYKNKDAKPFRASLSTDAIEVGDMGVADLSSVLEGMKSCEIKSYSLSDFKVRFPSSDVAILTYKGTQDATCGGQAAPAAVWASSTYVRKGSRWVGVAHQETPAK